MRYFEQVESPDTYAGSSDDFHFHYNRNSGGGQAFLGGSFYDADNSLRAASHLNGVRTFLRLTYRDSLGLPGGIDLNDPKAQYEIKPRGGRSTSMKFSIGNGLRPSVVIDAALCLPATNTVGNIAKPDASPLTTRNYWLQSMWLDVEEISRKQSVFVPRDLVFASSAGSRDGNLDLRFWSVDFRQRISDFLDLDMDVIESDEIRDSVAQYQSLFRGEITYSHEEFAGYRDKIMRTLAYENPSIYDGYSDVLPFLRALVAEEPTPHLAPMAIKKKKTETRPVDESHNLIFFGAPGTGKSFKLNSLAERSFEPENIRRVTFHPEYTYSQFVGTYKPVSDPGQSGKIAYLFVLGPLLDAYVDAVANPDENFVLIIEEINRANPAAVFGELFQLLDRDYEGESEYAVTVSHELKTELECRLNHLNAGGLTHPNAAELRLPSNLYLWCTMNSADQGVFPIDTAFRRRWDFRYVGLNDGAEKIADIQVSLGDGGWIYWNELRVAINEVLRKSGVSDDRLLGPFFLRPSDLTSGENFSKIFKEKVLLYLFEDAAKLRRKSVFREDASSSYELLCERFDELGEKVFAGMTDLPRTDPESSLPDSK